MQCSNDQNIHVNQNLLHRNVFSGITENVAVLLDIILGVTKVLEVGYCSLERSHHYFRIELYAWNVPNFVIFFTAIRFQSFCMFIKLRQQTNCLNVGTNCKSSRRIFRLEQLWKRRYCNLCRLPPQALSIDSIPQAQEKHR